MIERFNIAPPDMFNRQNKDGLFLYSPIVVVRAGDIAHIYIAGKTAVHKDGSVGCVGDLRGQIRMVCEALKGGLEYVGASLEDLVRTVTYVLDIDEYYEVCDERYKFFAKSLPTNTLLGVSRLAHPDMRVEIEGEAIVDARVLKNLDVRAPTLAAEPVPA